MLCDYGAMDIELDSPGKRLRWARERTGIDAATFAKLEGLNDKTYRAYENEQNLFSKRAAAFARRLNVTTDWLLIGGPTPDTVPPTILGAMESNAILAPPMEGASLQRMKRDVPVYGTALGADAIVGGEAIEQTMLNKAEVIGYRRRPVLLDGRADIYALYVQGSSMEPRHRDGAILYVEERRRPSVGDDAVIYLRVPDEHEGEMPSQVLVKTLVRKSASFIELEQYNPPKVFRIPMEQVARMDRVLTLDEMTD
jgi:transcriptional regulator with XRE-family HTH domain